MGPGARRPVRRGHRRAADLPRTAGQPPVRSPAARAPRSGGDAGDRRSPLRLGLGLRLPPGLSAPHPHAAATGPRYAGTGHHSYGEPTGHPRRGRPAGPGHRDTARLTGTVLTAAGGGTRTLPAAALRLGGPSTL